MTTESMSPQRVGRRLLAVIAVLALTGCSGGTTADQPEAMAPSPELPPQVLLSDSMRREPVPGWTITSNDLNFPSGTVMRPVRNIGDRGIFLGITDEGWWLFGLNVSNGQRTFGPIRLGSAEEATDFDCYVNGPPMVLCVRQGADQRARSTAWIVDTVSGEIAFEGLSDLRVYSQDQPQLEQIGDYVVARVAGSGMYGVGERAELTWFVPGGGVLPAYFETWARDSSPSNLAVQSSGGVADVVFSVADGSIVAPSLPKDVELERAVVYPGGFGYEYTLADDFSTTRVAFFDDKGTQLSEPVPDGRIEDGSLDLPMVSTTTSRLVFTIDGRQLLQLPASVAASEARRIGGRFFVTTTSDEQKWQQFDLGTGTTGKTCEGDSLGSYYIASDGDVAIALGGAPAHAIDLATCETLWALARSGPTEAKEVWKVHTTLIQRTNDRLFSLVPPA